MTESKFELSYKQKSELDKRVKRHKTGKSKSYTLREVKEYAFSKGESLNNPKISCF